MHRDVIRGRRQKPCVCEEARCAGADVDDFPKYQGLV